MQGCKIRRGVQAAIKNLDSCQTLFFLHVFSLCEFTSYVSFCSLPPKTRSTGVSKLEVQEEHDAPALTLTCDRFYVTRFCSDGSSFQVSTHPLQHLGELSPAVAAFGGG